MHSVIDFSKINFPEEKIKNTGLNLMLSMESSLLFVIIMFNIISHILHTGSKQNRITLQKKKSNI